MNPVNVLRRILNKTVYVIITYFLPPPIFHHRIHLQTAKDQVNHRLGCSIERNEPSRIMARFITFKLAAQVLPSLYRFV